MSATEFPAGTVTFLFTDIGGSARLWEGAPDAMRIALGLHDEIIQRAIAEHSGVVFKTIGDQFCVVFDRPEEAVLAAAACQERLTEQEWPPGIERIAVRMAIHTGTVVESQGDYFGITVNRVARLMSIAAPGQVLVSNATASLLLDAMPGDLQLRDLGRHPLKDLREPERTYQLTGPHLRDDFAALPSVDARLNNIPFQFSSFVGRKVELEEVSDALSMHRLVTIVGPGGIGKTRIAQHASRSLVDQFPRGMWLVELSTVQDPQLVPQAVGVVLGLHEDPRSPIEETLARFIGDESMLLVLDEAEHLLSGVARFAKNILGRCSSLRILVTSREPLHLAGECIARIGPLPEAPQLFRERARELAPNLPYDTGERDIIEICRRVDGIPLAIELAAAHVVALPLPELSARLSRRLDLLVSRDPTKSERHRTMRATIAWSYGLLTAEEAAVLRATAVFDATFDLTAICSVNEAQEDETLRVVEGLVMKSLLVTDPAPTSARYALATTVRDFLQEIVAKDGSLPSLQRRHFAHYQSYVADAIPAAVASEARVDLSVLDAEISNIRGALSWALQAEPAEGAATVVLLGRYWKSRGFLREGREWFRRYLGSEQVGGVLRASLLRRAATYATEQDDYHEAQSLSEESQALFEHFGDIGGAAEALHNLAVIEQRRGKLDEAMAYYESAIDKFREAKKTREESIVLYNLALMAFSRGQVSESEQLIQDATRVATAAAEELVLANATQFRAIIAMERGQLEEAEGLLQSAAEALSRLGSRFDYAEAQDALSLVYVRQGRIDDASVAARKCLAIGLEIDAASLLVYGLEALCEIAVQQGRFEDAASYLRASWNLRTMHAYRHTNTRNIKELETTLRTHFHDRIEILDQIQDIDVRKLVATLINEEQPNALRTNA